MSSSVQRPIPPVLAATPHCVDADSADQPGHRRRTPDGGQKVGGHRTKKDTVNEALKEYIQRRRQAKTTDLFGRIEIDAAYDYKKQRRRS
jgi:hypothetical protein